MVVPAAVAGQWSAPPWGRSVDAIMASWQSATTMCGHTWERKLSTRGSGIRCSLDVGKKVRVSAVTSDEGGVQDVVGEVEFIWVSAGVHGVDLWFCVGVAFPRTAAAGAWGAGRPASSGR
eukprot:12898098-Prorocentrum_lima.AAC.1